MLKKIKCLLRGHIWCLAVADPDGETTLPNGETTYFGNLDIQACIRCGKVRALFTADNE